MGNMIEKASFPTSPLLIYSTSVGADNFAFYCQGVSWYFRFHQKPSVLGRPSLRCKLYYWNGSSWVLDSERYNEAGNGKEVAWCFSHNWSTSETYNYATNDTTHSMWKLYFSDIKSNINTKDIRFYSGGIGCLSASLYSSLVYGQYITRSGKGDGIMKGSDNSGLPSEFNPSNYRGNLIYYDDTSSRLLVPKESWF